MDNTDAVSCRSFDDVVNFAIKQEENSVQFYGDFAKRAKNPGIREFFQELADEQKHHLETLKELDPYGLEEFKLEQVEELHLSDYLVDVTFREDLTYQEALTLAMKKQQKAYEFYVSWKDKCIHEKTHKVFEMLGQEELKHKRRLEEVYDDEVLTWD
jgi:rubrerythrin